MKPLYWVAVVGLVIAVALMIYGGAQPSDSYYPSVYPTRTPSRLSVSYGIPGSGKADITLRNAQGDTEQHRGVNLPYSMTFSAKHGQFVYISAQDDGYGGVICDLFLDGELVKHVKSTGDYTIATCSGTVP